ncbi:DUF397 domain-containing protein [Haloechinothrix sp. YIM 98757]|uniref:DUF397 domain-containing protein n=1 Tax=Haloechinothrix aidingensis TaxID=2752311 RepID=A0A838A282_9PSEU|nr:DUF397 domain-containing protein [Haloechinothrix aidingensis]MBA0125293.1 DUF397 domain-containing protein [Haloechinothrix aidingensis]
MDRADDRVRWRTSSYSNSEGGACVEVALSTLTRVRDTKDRDGGALNLPLPAWRAFTSALHEV